ncbi:hypothetical protein OG607_40545 [Streptomyces sp. NBC_01537]|uniref:hypothetical protein n=1 Tax=Streptomyces sp. NBC_01537 TaxID=2903896 RepID=UPI00386D9C07
MSSSATIFRRIVVPRKRMASPTSTPFKGGLFSVVIRQSTARAYYCTAANSNVLVPLLCGDDAFRVDEEMPGLAEMALWRELSEIRDRGVYVATVPRCVRNDSGLDRAKTGSRP